ncbi:hypothetical protein Cde04nite_11660 [Cellulomonas denverensis]|nr:hypothetical protein Cde04nite_11660 [Cellulomonas denverensis]
MADCTLDRVASETLADPSITRETVMVDTPACRATSAMVGRAGKAAAMEGTLMAVTVQLRAFGAHPLTAPLIRPDMK